MIIENELFSLRLTKRGVLEQLNMQCRLIQIGVPPISATIVERHFPTHYKNTSSGKPPRTLLDSYESKGRKAEKEPRPQKEFIHKFIFRRNKNTKKPSFLFSKSSKAQSAHRQS
jgi:hypothetical protein